MPLPARLTIILLAALLTACAGRSPVLEPSGVPPEPVSATAANDVLFRALGLVGTPVHLEFRQGENPFAGRRNKLNKRQINKRRRLMSHVKRKK